MKKKEIREGIKTFFSFPPKRGQFRRTGWFIERSWVWLLEGLLWSGGLLTGQTGVILLVHVFIFFVFIFVYELVATGR